MKIVHLITDLEVGGAEVMLSHLVGGCDPVHWPSAVISLTTIGPVGAHLQKSGIPVYEVGMRPAALNVAGTLRLTHLLRRLRPDILQTWLYHADMTGLIAGRLAGVPRILWNIRCAELDPLDHPRSLQWVVKLLAALSGLPAAIVCNSMAGRHEHERLGYRPRRWSVIPNGFDTELFRPMPAARLILRRKLGLTDDVPVVGMLARLHPMKDHSTFLRAAAMVAHGREDVQFVLAGRGVDASAKLAALVGHLSIGDRVRLLPEQDDAPVFLAALDIAVSASYGEAFPNVVGEAMACGAACVVTDVGDSRLLVGNTAAIVPPRDSAALAAGILQMLALDKASRDLLGRRARHRIQTDFSLRRVIDRYQALYRELAAPRSESGESQACAG